MDIFRIPNKNETITTDDFYFITPIHNYEYNVASVILYRNFSTTCFSLLLRQIVDSKNIM